MDWQATRFFPKDAYSFRSRPMNPQELFAANLALVERVIRIVCRRARVFDADEEDFAADVKLALVENDYAILRKYEGRSSLESYLTVVIQRMLADARNAAHGRFRASSEAQRLGPVAVLLEKLVVRDGRSLDEAMQHVRAIDATATRESMAAMLKRLPARAARAREVELESVERVIAGGEPADARAIADDRRRLANVAGTAFRRALDGLPTEDRALIRFHYAEQMTIAEIARMLDLPQRPLYRRMEWLLDRFRTALASAGIDRGAAVDLIGSEEGEMDFGLRDAENRAAPPVHRLEK
jgi:RNA polymerase sigma factor (sigma-70 family)